MEVNVTRSLLLNVHGKLFERRQNLEPLPRSRTLTPDKSTAQRRCALDDSPLRADAVRRPGRAQRLRQGAPRDRQGDFILLQDSAHQTPLVPTRTAYILWGSERSVKNPEKCIRFQILPRAWNTQVGIAGPTDYLGDNPRIAKVIVLQENRGVVPPDSLQIAHWQWIYKFADNNSWSRLFLRSYRKIEVGAIVL